MSTLSSVIIVVVIIIFTTIIIVVNVVIIIIIIIIIIVIVIIIVIIIIIVVIFATILFPIFSRVLQLSVSSFSWWLSEKYVVVVDVDVVDDSFDPTILIAQGTVARGARTGSLA